MSDLVEDFLTREKEGLGEIGLNEISSGFNGKINVHKIFSLNKFSKTLLVEDSDTFGGNSIAENDQTRGQNLANEG